MCKLIVVAVVLAVAVLYYQRTLEPTCTLRFAHSDAETIPFVECDNGEIREAKIK